MLTRGAVDRLYFPSELRDKTPLPALFQTIIASSMNNSKGIGFHSYWEPHTRTLATLVRLNPKTKVLCKSSFFSLTLHWSRWICQNQRMLRNYSTKSFLLTRTNYLLVFMKSQRNTDHLSASDIVFQLNHFLSASMKFPELWAYLP